MVLHAPRIEHRFEHGGSDIHQTPPEHETLQVVGVRTYGGYGWLKAMWYIYIYGGKHNG